MLQRSLLLSDLTISIRTHLSCEAIILFKLNMKRHFTDIDNFDGDDDEDEHESGETENVKMYESKTDSVIYLVDAREKMFLPSFEEANLPIIRCLESIRSAVRTKIFRTQKCICSIILLGTKKTENDLTLNNITVVQEFSALGAEHVLKIDELIKAIETITYKNEYGYDEFSLGDAFWLSSHTFSERSGNLNKTVVLFTNDDGPTSGDPNDENRALTQVQDMFKSVVTFELICLGKDFNINKFYKKIVLASKNDANYVIPDPVTNASEIIDRLTKTNLNHMSLAKLPFVISKDFRIGVSVHFLVRKAKIPFKIKLSKATNERVFTKTEYFEMETGAVAKKEDLIKSQTVANKEINFTLAELSAIQNIGKKEIRLLGFKPSSVLRLENFVKPCAFLYPDETEYKGSSVFFTALLKRCIAKEVVPICTFCPRKSSSYRFVALIPQDESSGDGKDPKLPPGFVVFFLPFAEEVRTIEQKKTERANPKQIEAAVNLIKKLKAPYKLSYFTNPRIRHHWAAIEALALDLKEPEEVGDSTIPNYDLISQRSGQVAKEFMDAVYEEDYDPQNFTAPKKPRPQFVKQRISGGVDDVEDIVRQGKGEQLTNHVLKAYLTSIGETKGLHKVKKADLLEKIRAHLDLN